LIVPFQGKRFQKKQTKQKEHPIPRIWGLRQDTFRLIPRAICRKIRKDLAILARGCLRQLCQNKSLAAEVIYSTPYRHEKGKAPAGSYPFCFSYL